MALRAVPDHPKFADLMAHLGRPKYVALGCLESIWHFTGRFTPAGNIGKYTDQAIEAWVGWDGDPGALMAALINSRWIDRNNAFRLVVHDWGMHADNATKLALKRAGKTFCTGARVATPSQQCGDTVQQNETPSRLPEPEPVPVPVKKTKTKAPAKAKPLPDPRATEFRQAFQESFSLANGVPAPWDAKEATNLARFLKSNPTLTLAQWNRILFHRSQSPLNQAASLSTWIARSLAWLEAPADEWGKKLNGGNRNGYVNRGQARTDANDEAARRAAASILTRFDETPGGSARC
jgi:hypothetical protein